MDRDGAPQQAGGPTFEDYDERVAASLADLNDKIGGLPGYLGLRIVDAGPGTTDAEVEIRPELLTPFGNLHGGVLAATCDHVLGSVCYPVIPRGAWAAVTEFKVNYLVPVSAGVLQARARIESLTKRTAVVRVELRNEGRLAGLAQGTVSIMVPRADPPAT